MQCKKKANTRTKLGTTLFDLNDSLKINIFIILLIFLFNEFVSLDFNGF